MVKNVYEHILNCKTACSPVLKANVMGRKQKRKSENGNYCWRKSWK